MLLGTGGGVEKTAAEMSNWYKVVALVRADFGEGLLAEEAVW